MEVQSIKQVKELARLAKARNRATIKGVTGIIYNIQYPGSNFELLAMVGKYVQGLGELKDIKNLTSEKVENLTGCMEVIIKKIVTSPKITEKPTEDSLSYEEIPGEDRELVFNATMKKLNLTKKKANEVETFRPNAPGKGSSNVGGRKQHITK